MTPVTTRRLRDVNQPGGARGDDGVVGALGGDEDPLAFWAGCRRSTAPADRLTGTVEKKNRRARKKD